MGGLAGAVIAAVACVATAPSASASAAGFRDQIGGQWNAQYDHASLQSERLAVREINIAITPTELILYMPDYPVARDSPIDFTPGALLWSMDGGTVQPHIPLSALASALRPGI